MRVTLSIVSLMGVAVLVGDPVHAANPIITQVFTADPAGS
jgi:hypothetical protein